MVLPTVEREAHVRVDIEAQYKLVGNREDRIAVIDVVRLYGGQLSITSGNAYVHWVSSNS